MLHLPTITSYTSHYLSSSIKKNYSPKICSFASYLIVLQTWVPIYMWILTESLASINVLFAAVLLHALLKNHVSWNKILYCYNIFSDENLWKIIVFSANANTFYNIYNKMFAFHECPIISLCQISSSWSHPSEYRIPTRTPLQCSLGSPYWKIVFRWGSIKKTKIELCNRETYCNGNHYSKCIFLGQLGTLFEIEN
jgi:hypothetical protein